MNEQEKNQAIYAALHFQADSLLDAARDLFGEVSDKMRERATDLIKLAEEFE